MQSHCLASGEVICLQVTVRSLCSTGSPSAIIQGSKLCVAANAVAWPMTVAIILVSPKDKKIRVARLCDQNTCDQNIGD